jgi:hypothetical protein
MAAASAASAAPTGINVARSRSKSPPRSRQTGSHSQVAPYSPSALNAAPAAPASSAQRTLADMLTLARASGRSRGSVRGGSCIDAGHLESKRAVARASKNVEARGSRASKT